METAVTIRDLDIYHRITDFLRSAPRFKVVVLHNDTFDASFPHVNIGKVVATYLKDNDFSEQAFYDVKDYLSSHIEAATQTDDQIGKYVCLTNMGILFEKDLDFSPTEYLSNIAKNTLLLIHWSGVLTSNKLFLLDYNSPYFIDLTNINHTNI